MMECGEYVLFQKIMLRYYKEVASSNVRYFFCKTTLSALRVSVGNRGRVIDPHKPPSPPLYLP